VVLFAAMQMDFYDEPLYIKIKRCLPKQRVSALFCAKHREAQNRALTQEAGKDIVTY
jgi:hypothetical protein